MYISLSVIYLSSSPPPSPRKSPLFSVTSERPVCGVEWDGTVQGGLTSACPVQNNEDYRSLSWSVDNTKQSLS